MCRVEQDRLESSTAAQKGLNSLGTRLSTKLRLSSRKATAAVSQALSEPAMAAPIPRNNGLLPENCSKRFWLEPQENLNPTCYMPALDGRGSSFAQARRPVAEADVSGGGQADAWLLAPEADGSMAWRHDHRRVSSSRSSASFSWKSRADR